MSLPYLSTGKSLKDLTEKKQSRTQQFEFKNGIPVVKNKPSITLTPEEIEILENYRASQGSKAVKPVSLPAVMPAHVVLDKKVLLFNGYFKQTVHESPQEFYRVRIVKIYYYLEDDSISVVEPIVENSGLPQGKLVNRQKIPKDNTGATYHWTDFNIGNDLTIYSRTFHIYDTNQWTRSFLVSQGVVVNDSEQAPTDPYILSRVIVDKPDITTKTRSEFDKLKQFIALDRRVLRFFCLWDDRDQVFGERRKFILHYYLVDDTVEVREVKENNNGREPFPVLIKRQRIARNPRDIPADFPTVALELKESELQDALSPIDFAIGSYVYIFGRPFFLYDADDFTKEFYRRNFADENLEAVDITEHHPAPPRPEVPPHTGFGSAEDGLRSVFVITPKAPKDEVQQLFDYGNACLRFSAHFLAPAPEDRDRKFIVSYHLATDFISIQEPPQRNSGILGGKFCSARKVQIPGSDRNNPTYYTQKDMVVGKIIEVNKHKFILEGCDQFVNSFVTEHPHLFA